MKDFILLLIVAILIIGAWILADYLSSVVTMEMVIKGLFIAFILYIIKIILEERR